MKKLLLIITVIGLIICLLAGCNTTVPAEGEGEGEGEGEEEVSRVVMVEVFSQSGCANCEIVEPLIEQLAEEYERSEVIFVEERAYGIYSLDEIRARYNWYLPNSADRGTPNILFNGFNTTHIHGSSTYYTIKSKIQTELNKDVKIKIIAARNSDTTTTTISGTIKNIGSTTLGNLVINGMTFRNRGQVGLKYCVMDIFAEQQKTINNLASGDSHTFSFTLEGFDWDGNNINGVIFVQNTDSSKKEILQAFFID